MNKIWLVTQREFLTRVKKRSFIVMSMLGPILFASFFALTFYFSTTGDTEVRKIAVIDSSGIFIKKIPDTKFLHFEYVISNLPRMKKLLGKTDYYGILFISPIVAYSPRAVQFYSYQQPSLNITQHISSALEKEIRNQKLMAYNINNIDDILKSVETSINVETVKITESGEERHSNTAILMGIAYISSLLIYLFILMFGVQVMRGIMEEKSNRIVEVIISSVKPFQLMMGKVFGVAMTALTQFFIWIVLSTFFLILVKAAILPDISPVTVAAQPQDLMQAHVHSGETALKAKPILDANFSKNDQVRDVIALFDSIPYVKLILFFLFFFIGGYLLYSSLFAAIGEQPITIPIPSSLYFP